MKSKTFQNIVDRIYRKLNYCVDSYARMVIENKNRRFNYYFDWKSFNLGFGFCKTTGISGWNYMLSLDLTFFSCWIYFSKKV
jgi:hypothetical protein